METFLRVYFVYFSYYIAVHTHTHTQNKINYVMLSDPGLLVQWGMSESNEIELAQQHTWIQFLNNLICSKYQQGRTEVEDEYVLVNNASKKVPCSKHEKKIWYTTDYCPRL